jgi:hypothetical protein
MKNEKLKMKNAKRGTLEPTPTLTLPRSTGGGDRGGQIA